MSTMSTSSNSGLDPVMGLNTNASNPRSFKLVMGSTYISPCSASPMIIFQSNGIFIFLLPICSTAAGALKLSRNINGMKEVVWIRGIGIIQHRKSQTVIHIFWNLFQRICFIINCKDFHNLSSLYYTDNWPLCKTFSFGEMSFCKFTGTGYVPYLYRIFVFGLTDTSAYALDHSHKDLPGSMRTRLKIRGILMPTAATPYVAIIILFVAVDTSS
jgi:hypothetical protein